MMDKKQLKYQELFKRNNKKPKNYYMPHAGDWGSNKNKHHFLYN